MKVFFIFMLFILAQPAVGGRGALVFPYVKKKRTSWSEPTMNHQDQLLNGVTLMQDTLFQDVHHLHHMHLGLKRKKFQHEIQRQELVLRRLFLLFAMGGLQYRSETMTDYRPWPFPVATALTQGQRVMIQLQGVSAHQFLDFITNGHSTTFHKRNYSSHGIQETADGEIYEVKIKTPFRRVLKTEKLLGMNFPLGGLGSSLPDGKIVGPMGREYSIGKQKLHKKKQVGHLHLYTRDFPARNVSVILVGIESCAPGTSNQFGCTHNLLSGIKNQKVRRSSSGGLKWSKIKTDYEAPREYGGKVIILTADQYAQITMAIKDILAKPLEDQKEILYKVLQSNAAEAMTFLSGP